MRFFQAILPNSLKLHLLGGNEKKTNNEGVSVVLPILDLEQ